MSEINECIQESYVDDIELGFNQQPSTPVIEVADTVESGLTGTEVMR